MAVEGFVFVLFGGHFHSCRVVSPVHVVVSHRTADQDFQAIREVVKFGEEEEVVYESGCHSSAHGTHPVHL